MIRQIWSSLPLGFRTLKSAVGVTIAVAMAQLFSLEHYPAAGILTLLCIQPSRQQSLMAATSRLVACIVGLVLATLVFELFGYDSLGLFLFLLMFIPIAVWLGIKEGIVSSVVIVMYLMIHGRSAPLDLDFMMNMLTLIGIGLTVALAVNWYMPSQRREMESVHQQVDELFSAILRAIARYLRDDQYVWSGEELITLGERLDEARIVAVMEVENLRGTWRWGNNVSLLFREHIEQRTRQFAVLQRMLPFVSRIHQHGQLEQSIRIGGFVQQLSERFATANSEEAMQLATDLRKLRDYHRTSALPATREQFEDRANLFALTNELEWLVDSMQSRSHTMEIQEGGYI